MIDHSLKNYYFLQEILIPVH